MNGEIWKDVIGYEGKYQISSLCRVRTLKRFAKFGKNGMRVVKPKIITQMINNAGYFYVQFYNNNKVKNFMVHRLFAIAFISNPLNKPHINHKNGIKTDNRIENLEWCTHKENMIHALKNGYFIGFSGTEKGSTCPSSKLNELQVLSIKERLKNGESIKKISKDYPVTESAISEIKAGRSWSHIHIPEDF